MENSTMKRAQNKKNHLNKTRRRNIHAQNALAKHRWGEEAQLLEAAMANCSIAELPGCNAKLQPTSQHQRGGRLDATWRSDSTAAKIALES